MAGKTKLTDLAVIEPAHALSEPHRGVIMRFKTALTILSCLFVLSVAGCVSKVYMHPLRVTDQSVPSSTVYVFRENTWIGSGIATMFYLDGKKLLQLRRSTYTKVRLKAGTYDFEIISGRASAKRSMTFATGETYLLLKNGSNEQGIVFYAEQITEEGAKSLMATMTEVH